MAVDIRTLDPDDPGYEAAVEAALREEDMADGLPEPPAASSSEEVEAAAEAAVQPAAGTAAKAPEGDAVAPAQGATAAPTVAGVLGKDGKTVLPYAALRGARTEAQQQRLAREAAELRAEESDRQNAELKAQLEALQSAGGASADMRQRAEEGLLTDEERDDHPVLAKIEAAIKKIAADRVQPPPTQPATAAPPAQKEPPSQAATTEDDVQEAIDSVPELAGWQATGGEMWARAVAHDNALRDSPKWKGRPLNERFAQVVKLVGEEFEDANRPAATASSTASSSPPPPPPAQPRQDPKQVARAAARTAPNTLSDFKGGAPDPSSDPIERLPATSQVAKFMDMTDDEIDRHLARLG